MKNHADALIFHRRVCAGATNSESQMKNRIRGFFIACLRKERSGKEDTVKENNKAKELARLAIEALEDKKAQDIHIIDISEVSVIADYFIIAGGNSVSQLQALCDNVEEKLGQAGNAVRQIEGYQTANWILMDFGDVIVHIFDKENRLLFDLERIWRDGKQIEADSLTEKNSCKS